MARLHPSSVRAGSARSGFTLIEMLAVLIIVGLLLGISSVALLRLGTTEGVRQGATALESTLGLARQHAIVQGERVYVLFMPPDQDFTNLGRLKTFAGRGYAAYAVNPRTPNEGRFLTEWNSLPMGVLFDYTSGRPNTPFAGTGPTTRGNVRLRRDGDDSASPAMETRSFPALRFRTTGAPFVLDGYRVYITEGFTDIHRDTGQVSVEIRSGNRMEAVVRVAPHTGVAYTESYGLAP